MVYQPDNAYTKKFGHQFGQYVTNPDNHLAGENVFTQYSYTKKEKNKFSFQHGENGRAELNNDRYYLDWLESFIKEGENVGTF